MMNNITTTINITDTTNPDYLQVVMVIPIFAAILLIILCNKKTDIYTRIKKNKITPYKGIDE